MKVLLESKKKAIKSLGLFELFPSYVTCYNHEGDFEYALIDENN